MESTQRNNLIEQNLRLVDSIAHKIQKQFGTLLTVDLEEIIAIGREGLVEAANRFDPDKGIAFTTFSYYRIKGRILDVLFPRRYVYKKSKEKMDVNFSKNANEIISSNAQDPMPENSIEAAKKLKQTFEQMVAAYCLQNLSKSNESEIEKRGFNESPEENILNQQEIESLKESLKSIPEDEMNLINLMYFEECSLTEAAQKLEKSVSWASRTHTKALLNLKTKLQKKENISNLAFTGIRG